ncbi:MAG: RDD family protein [Chloroflexota bacterium]
MTSTDEFLNIETPENVAFGYEVVGIGSRFIAGIVDSAIIGGILAILGVVIFAIASPFNEESSTLLVAIGLFMFFVILWGYYIFFEMSWNGRSPGKRAAGLRVIKRDGTPITLSESIIRNLLRTIDSLPAFYGVGIIAMFIDEKSRRLGDIMAGTLVVRDNEDITLANISAPTRRPAIRAPSQIDQEAHQWPVHKLNDDDIRLAEDFLVRRAEINNANDLGYKIAKRLMKKMELSTSEMVFMSDTIYALDSIVRQYHRE